MTDYTEDVVVEARVPVEHAEYLEEWADVVGCDVADVAGDSISQFLEEQPIND
ncbi:hypothetical protein [Halorubrum sp. AJ67]|uniref:hypothetical protein n=1 Tax=Halorubrum sp. AJ67 TaxID=1173487 RepID=UPI0003DD343C|nr:hypothetical protein [Halorubrum sp. AJ67]CDK39655.1 hypothetical protein BN903_54 [Halorubrum sp. AJ67]